MTRGRPDAGETAASIVARGDDEAWPYIERELRAGATLLRLPKLKRAYCHRGVEPYGRGISDARVRKLERDGVIRHIGVDRYALAEGGDD